MHELGHGRIAWCARTTRRRDAHNPHAHSCSRTPISDTGRKVIADDECTRVRKAKENGWRVRADNDGRNAQSMVRAHQRLHGARGLDVRYDPRSLKKQGIDRVPQIHIGPKADALNQKGYGFEEPDYHRGQKQSPTR